MKKSVLLSLVVTLVGATGSIAQTGSNEKLCTQVLKPEVSKFALHWEVFNMFGNSQDKFVESGFTQAGEGDSCKIKSVRDNGKSIEKPCTWTPRSSCDLVLGQEPITHKFSVGSYQYGKLQWIGNE